MAGRLGLAAGQVVQEFGYDDDVDDELRAAVEELTGNELADEDARTSSTPPSTGGATATATWSTPWSTR